MTPTMPFLMAVSSTAPTSATYSPPTIHVPAVAFRLVSPFFSPYARTVRPSSSPVAETSTVFAPMLLPTMSAT